MLLVGMMSHYSDKSANIDFSKTYFNLKVLRISDKHIIENLI